MKILKTDNPEIKELKQLVNYHIIESKSWKITSNYWRKKYFKETNQIDWLLEKKKKKFQNPFRKKS